MALLLLTAVYLNKLRVPFPTFGRKRGCTLKAQPLCAMFPVLPLPLTPSPDLGPTKEGAAVPDGGGRGVAGVRGADGDGGAAGGGGGADGRAPGRAQGGPLVPLALPRCSEFHRGTGEAKEDALFTQGSSGLPASTWASSWALSPPPSPPSSRASET